MTFNELQDKLFVNYQAGFVSDEQLVQIIELAVMHLNLKTVSNTAEFRGKSYNGVNKYNQPDLIIDSVKFYINND